MQLRQPTYFAKSIHDITPQLLRKMGVVAVLLDVDNTLAHHGAPIPFDGAIAWTKALTEAGFRLMIVSNNKKDRVAPFAKKFHLPFVWRAVKPLPLGYSIAAKKLHAPFRKTVIIGDQVYTDIVGANLLGMQSILLEPAEAEQGWSFFVRRRLEQSVRKQGTKPGRTLPHKEETT